MRRLVLPAIVMPLLALGACAPQEAEEASTSEETVSTQETSAPEESTTPAEDDSPTPDEVSPSPEPEESTPGAGDTESPAQSASAPEEDADDPDLVDGVRTNDFNRMPQELGGMTRRESETDPQQHSARFNYMAPDESAMSQMLAYFPQGEDGQPGPVTSPDDPGYELAITSAVDAFAEVAEPTQRQVNAGDLTWDCVEASQAQNDGEVDHSLCISLAYGRVIEVQYVTLHEPDIQTWQAAVDANLALFGEAITEISG